MGKYIKFFMSIALISVMILSVVVSADPVRTSSNQASGTPKIVAYGKKSKGITPRETQVINPIRHTGTGAYKGEFTTAPENGKCLDVYYKNDGTGTVYMTIFRNGQEFLSDYVIASGVERTQTFEEQVASGISGDWKVYIYTKDGAKIDISVSARQF